MEGCVNMGDYMVCFPSMSVLIPSELYCVAIFHRICTNTIVKERFKKNIRGTDIFATLYGR